MRTSNENRFNDRSWLYTRKRVRNRRYPVEAITDGDYVYDVALLPNTPTQDESLLHGLQQASGGIVLHVNRGKTEYMYLNHKRDIYLRNSGSLKLVKKFTYQGRSVLSNKNDTSEQVAKACTAIDMLSIIQKLDLSDKIQRNVFKVVVVSFLLHE